MKPTRKGILFAVMACVTAGGMQARLLAAEPSAAEVELRGVCDSLIDHAVKRSYGWGWQADSNGGGSPTSASPTNAPQMAIPGNSKAAVADKGKLPQEVMVSYEPEISPAAALVLLEAGVALNEDRYIQAARMAYRGFSAATDNAGRLPAEIPFGPTQIGKRTKAGVVANQSPAAAAVAVMLSFERLVPEEHDKVFSPTARLLTPLSRLVMNTGAVATDEIDERKVVRLDTNRLRDVAIALALSANIHSDTAHKQALQRISDYLMRIRTTDAGANLGRGLWVTAYDIDGQPVTDVDTLPAQPNMPASANSATILLLSQLRGGDAASFAALGLVADAAVSIRQPNGDWQKLIAPTAQPAAGGTDANPTGGVFGGPMSDAMTGAWGWPALLKAIGDLKLLGREDFLNLTKSVMPFERWAAWMACGLMSDPPPTDLPLSAREVDGFMAAHAAWFPKTQLIATASNAELSKRAIGLLLRLEWERKFSTVPATSPANLPAGGK